MRRSRTRRGSALIFAVTLITAITIYYVAAQELMMASVRSQQRFENRTKARLALESAAASVISEYRHGLLTLPASRTVTVAGVAVTTNVIDNTLAVPRTMKVSTSLTLKGHTFADSIVVGQRIAPTQWNYALFVNGAISWDGVLTTGSLGSLGDFYKRTSTSGGGYTHTINGDFEGGGTISSNFTVTGTKWPQAPTITFNTPLVANYLAALDTTYGSSSMNGYTFTDYGPTKTHLVYRGGNLNIRGAFTGNGVIFVTGDLDIQNDITVTGGKLVLICDGDVRLSRNNAVVNAFVFSENDVEVQNQGMTVIGALLTDTLDLQEDITIIYDPYFWSNPSERARFKLPGFWP